MKNELERITDDEKIINKDILKVLGGLINKYGETQMKLVGKAWIEDFEKRCNINRQNDYYAIKLKKHLRVKILELYSRND